MEKITRFKDIPQFTRNGSYQVDMDIKRIPGWIEIEQKEMNLQLNPNFQRGHVWTEEQQIAWLEFFLRGGNSGNVIYFNCPSWHYPVKDGAYNDYVCVDGLQRLTAICRFINNEIKVFGSYFKEYEDPRILMRHTMKINVNDLQTEKEVLQWYIDMNSCGTQHSEEEIERVKRMMDEISLDDFIDEIESAYQYTTEKGFDSIVIAIDTNLDNTYYINDTEEGDSYE